MRRWPAFATPIVAVTIVVPQQSWRRTDERPRSPVEDRCCWWAGDCYRSGAGRAERLPVCAGAWHLLNVGSSTIFGCDGSSLLPRALRGASAVSISRRRAVPVEHAGDAPGAHAPLGRGVKWFRSVPPTDIYPADNSPKQGWQQLACCR